MGQKESSFVFDDDSLVDPLGSKIRTPFRFWLDDTWHRTVRYSKEYPWLYSVAVWVPVLVLAVLFKLVKYEMLTPPAGPPVARVEILTMAGVLMDHGLMPALTFVAAVLVGLLVQNRFASRGYFLLPATTLSFALFAFAIDRVVDTSPDWFSAGFVVSIQQDFFWAAIAVSSTALLLAFVRGILRRFFLVVLQWFAIAIAWLCCFDFGYFLQTGSIADSYMLMYSVKHFSGLSSLVGSELDFASVMVIAAPVIFAALPVYLANSKSSRNRVHVHSYSWRMKRGVVMTLLVVGGSIYAQRMPLPESVRMLRTSVPAGLIGNRDVFDDDIKLDSFEGEPANWPEDSFSFVATDSSRFPNVVFVILESTRSYYKPNRTGISVSPFLDSLRAESIHVPDMSVVVPHTNKALVPILCGVYPELTQTESRSITKTCLPTLLGSHGYESAFFTTADLDFENKRALVTDMGFDDVVRPDPANPNGFATVNYFGLEDDALLDPSRTWIEQKMERGVPFFATFLTVTAHHDYNVPPSWNDRSFSDQAEYNDYLNAVAYQDAFVRKLFASFSERGLLSNTIVAVLSDHGEAFSEHGLQLHSAVLFQEVANPLTLIHAPMLVAPQIVDGPRQQIDMVPTIADLLRFDYSKTSLPGRSLFAAADSSREMYMAGWVENSSLAYRKGSTKFIYNFRRTPTQVFDMSNDPDELSDLAESLWSDSLNSVERRVLTWRRVVNNRYQNEQVRGGHVPE